MTVYRPEHQDWHDKLGFGCTCDEAWAARGIVDVRCWYHRVIDVLDEYGFGELLSETLYVHREGTYDYEKWKPVHDAIVKGEAPDSLIELRDMSGEPFDEYMVKVWPVEVDDDVS